MFEFWLVLRKNERKPNFIKIGHRDDLHETINTFEFITFYKLNLRCSVLFLTESFWDVGILSGYIKFEARSKIDFPKSKRSKNKTKKNSFMQKINKIHINLPFFHHSIAFRNQWNMETILGQSGWFVRIILWVEITLEYHWDL
jgi:hypothetical protein